MGFRMRIVSPLAVVLAAAITVPCAGMARADTAGPELVPATADQILAAVRSSNAKAVVVNLWATWCTPCRQEFPDLMRFFRAFKDRGVRLVLVSGDFPDDTQPAREFLSSQGVDFQSFLKSGQDESFINTLDTAWTGALPATFVYDAKGERRHSFLGPVTYDALEKEVAPLLDARP
jgi:thiol-disulfide isomerase/thioredoxin